MYKLKKDVNLVEHVDGKLTPYLCEDCGEKAVYGRLTEVGNYWYCTEHWQALDIKIREALSYPHIPVNRS